MGTWFNVTLLIALEASHRTFYPQKTCKPYLQLLSYKVVFCPKWHAVWKRRKKPSILPNCIGFGSISFVNENKYALRLCMLKQNLGLKTWAKNIIIFLVGGLPMSIIPFLLQCFHHALNSCSSLTCANYLDSCNLLTAVCTVSMHPFSHFTKQLARNTKINTVFISTLGLD